MSEGFAFIKQMAAIAERLARLTAELTDRLAELIEQNANERRARAEAEEQNALAQIALEEERRENERLKTGKCKLCSVPIRERE